MKGGAPEKYSARLSVSKNEAISGESEIDQLYFV